MWWMLDLNIFLSTRFFSLSYRYCHFLLLLTLFLRAPVSGGCILPWCPVQCLLHFWTNKLIDWFIDSLIQRSQAVAYNLDFYLTALTHNVTVNVHCTVWQLAIAFFADVDLQSWTIENIDRHSCYTCVAYRTNNGYLGLSYANSAFTVLRQDSICKRRCKVMFNLSTHVQLF